VEIAAGGDYFLLFRTACSSMNTTTSGSPNTSIWSLYLSSGVGEYASIGCYVVSSTGLELPNQLNNPNKTIGNCAAACSAKQYVYAGLKFGGERWCRLRSWMVLCRRIAAHLAMTIRRRIVVLVRDSIFMSSIEGNVGAVNQIYFAGNSDNVAQGDAAGMNVSNS
jgi:hypothetical protein